MTSLDLERREPARNRQRFYTIAVTRTRFGGWGVETRRRVDVAKAGATGQGGDRDTVTAAGREAEA